MPDVLPDTTIYFVRPTHEYPDLEPLEAAWLDSSAGGLAQGPTPDEWESNSDFLCACTCTQYPDTWGQTQDNVSKNNKITKYEYLFHQLNFLFLKDGHKLQK